MKEKNIGKIIAIIGRQNQRYVAKEMNKIGITGSEYVFLANIPEDRDITQQEICKDFELDPAFATRSIKSLIEKGYVVKVKSQRDSRAYTLKLTEEGRQKKKQVKLRLTELESIINGDMDEAEIENLHEELVNIKQRLRGVLEEGRKS